MTKIKHKVIEQVDTIATFVVGFFFFLTMACVVAITFAFPWFFYFISKSEFGTALLFVLLSSTAVVKHGETIKELWKSCLIYEKTVVHKIE